jgi:hypothetical protein
MNAFTTEYLARDHMADLHAEAKRNRLAAAHRGNRASAGFIARLSSRIRSIGRIEQPAPAMTTRHAA